MSREFAFFDSNTLVAVTVPEHEHHRASSARLAKIVDGGGACAAHSLAEIYTTLTRPNRYGFPPTDAARIVQQMSETFKTISLTPAEFVRTIEETALLGLPGAIIYDALVMACARKINARTIYTWNVKHFRLVAPDLAKRIREP